MKIDSKRKMEKVCRVMEYLADLLIAISVAAVAFLILLLAIMFVAGPEAAAELTDSGYSLVQTELMLGAMILVGAVETVCFWYLRRVFRRARFGSPFSEETAHSLRLAAAFMLLAGLIMPLVGLLARLFSAGSSGFFDSLDLNPFVFALFFYALSLMFDYGAALQRESDETL